MNQIVGIRFQTGDKVVPCATNGAYYAVGTRVLAETSHGVDSGIVVKIFPESVTKSGKQCQSVMRRVNAEDLRRLAENNRIEQDAFQACQEKINLYRLNMRLVKVHMTFDRNKLLFYFTSENRVDFRQLVKELASIFHTRIEMRQIGVRDEAKLLGGLGVCGREFCCKNHLCQFQPVSIHMAKAQGISLNTTKISGCCGRLMCCLQYEDQTYRELLAEMPRVGERVRLKDGRSGEVKSLAPISNHVTVSIDGNDTTANVSCSELVRLSDKS